MKFTLEIHCDTDAFGRNEVSRNVEVSYILENISRCVEDGKVFGTVRDTDGSKVGTYQFKITDE